MTFKEELEKLLKENSMYLYASGETTDEAANEFVVEAIDQIIELVKTEIIGEDRKIDKARDFPFEVNENDFLRAENELRQEQRERVEG